MHTVTVLYTVKTAKLNVNEKGAEDSIGVVSFDTLAI